MPRILAWVLAAMTGVPMMAQNAGVDVTKGIGIDQHLGDPIPGHLVFRDEQGEEVRLGEYFGKDRPVILMLVYYECPMMCTVALNKLTETLRSVSLEPGEEFSIVTVSFDPEETPKLARIKKAEYLKAYDRSGAEGAWAFLTGEAESIRRLTAAAGFRYRFDEETQEYVHPTGVIVLTPKGRLARYLFGVNYHANDLKLALMEASDRQIGTLTDQFLPLCYRYNATQGKYTADVYTFLRAGGVLTLVALGGGLALMSLLQRRRQHEHPAAEASAAEQEPAFEDGDRR